MEEHNNKISLWQMFILILSVYVLAVFFIDTVFKLPDETCTILLAIDNIICVIFILDFIYHLFTAENKLKFLKWGWIDLVSSIPYIPALRIGRVVRLIRIVRILRSLRSARIIVKYLFNNKAKSVFVSIVLITLILAVFSSIAILNVEISADSNIKNIGDALWWVAVTLSTVGYGDKYPVTSEGRIIGLVLMLFGIGLYGTFTAYIASLFIVKENEKPADFEQRMLDEIRSLREEIRELKDSGNKK